MDNKNCYHCKHSIKVEMSYGTGKEGEPLPPVSPHLIDCAKGHFNEIKEVEQSTGWLIKVSEIEKNCEDFEN